MTSSSFWHALRLNACQPSRMRPLGIFYTNYCHLSLLFHSACWALPRLYVCMVGMLHARLVFSRLSFRFVALLDFLFHATSTNNLVIKFDTHKYTCALKHTRMCSANSWLQHAVLVCLYLQVAILTWFLRLLAIWNYDRWTSERRTLWPTDCDLSDGFARCCC